MTHTDVLCETHLPQIISGRHHDVVIWGHAVYSALVTTYQALSNVYSTCVAPVTHQLLRSMGYRPTDVTTLTLAILLRPIYAALIALHRSCKCSKVDYRFGFFLCKECHFNVFFCQLHALLKTDIVPKRLFQSFRHLHKGDKQLTLYMCCTHVIRIHAVLLVSQSHAC